LRELREQVRVFLDASERSGAFVPQCDSWLVGFSPAFSTALAEQGWLGMTWSQDYGGHQRSAAERLVVVEELLARGAPVAAHWIADRQSGPQIARFGTEEAKKSILPAIASGSCFFALGLSEPGSGSDLASVRTRATRHGSGWRISGQKVWTSGAHHAHYLSVLCRTTGSAEDRQRGLSVFVVDARAPGVEIKPIRLISGEHHFNEVFFDEVEVEDSMMIGAEGEGWSVVTSELSLERSGPERYLSTFPLLDAVVRRLPDEVDPLTRRRLGDVASDIVALREMSTAIAERLDAGADPVVEAAAFKDLGTRFESQLVHVVREVVASQPSVLADGQVSALITDSLLASPGFTLRGGTNEILRGIVARGLGVR
ncbi:acyl-CoA dehydrogenase family protein, partial [Nocardioides pyridinolyticus]